MRRSALATLVRSLLLFAVPSVSQNLLQSAPTCAQSCGALLGVQTTCTPAGGAAVTNLQTYKDCFCGTANVPLNSAPQSYCVDTCPQPNQYIPMQKWFNNYCNFAMPSSAPTPTPAVSTTVAGSSTTAPARTRHRSTSTGPKSPGSVPTGSGLPTPGAQPFGEENPNESWWAGHYQWIVMVIILIIGFSIIIAVSIYFKRRYDSRHNNSPELPSNNAWAPNTSQLRSSSIYGDEPGQALFSRDKGTASSSAGRSWPG